MRCHIPLDELRRLQACQARRRAPSPEAPREDPRRRCSSRPAGRSRCAELELAAPGPEEVLVRLRASGVCHSDYNAIDGTAETRCPAVLGHEGAGVVEAVGEAVTRVAVGDHVALSWAPVVRGLRRVPARPALALLDGVAGDGDRRPDGRHAAPLPQRRRAGLPLLVPLHVRRGVRRARALLRADPARRAVRDRRARGLRGHDRSRSGVAHGRRATRRPRGRDRLRRGRVSRR